VFTKCSGKGVFGCFCSQSFGGPSALLTVNIKTELCAVEERGLRIHPSEFFRQNSNLDVRLLIS
jgi:hypothetical protein